MNKHLLITEARGSLGSRACEYFSSRDGYEVVGVTHRELDIEDFVVVSAFVKAVRPDYVLHYTAISSTGVRKRNPVLSERINVRGAVNLTKVCRKAGSHVIFTGSDQIYNTSHSLEPNREGSEGKPGSVYGRDKKRTEEVILAYLPGAVALRLAWLYDAPSRGRIAGQGLLQKLTDALKERWGVEFPIHDYRGITHVREVVHHLRETMGLPGGVYSFGNENRYNTFNTARLLLRELVGGDFGSILKCDDEHLVSHPRDLIMDTDKVRSHGIRFFNTSGGIYKYCLGHKEMSQAWY